MPYDPNEPTALERDGHHSLVWLGALLSVFLFVSIILGVSRYIEGWAGLIVGLYIVTFTMSKRVDDYFLALARNGARWAIAVIGFWLSAQALIGLTEGYYGTGYSAGGSYIPSEYATWQIPALFNSAFFLATTAALAFHIGFLVEHLTGRE